MHASENLFLIKFSNNHISTKTKDLQFGCTKVGRAVVTDDTC